MKLTPRVAWAFQAICDPVVEGTATETGKDFFRALVRDLASALGKLGAWVTEYLPEERRLRALAMWLGGRYVEHYEYLTGAALRLLGV